MWFSKNGRALPGHSNQGGFGQSCEEQSHCLDQSVDLLFSADVVRKLDRVAGQPRLMDLREIEREREREM